jgi:NAD-dependent dihydropyrimidine dehydrogenase PreA subunit
MIKNLVVFCKCQSRKDAPEWIKTARYLEGREDIPSVSLTDLCGWCALSPQRFINLISQASTVLIIACHPRAVKLLLQQAGIADLKKIKFFNLLDNSHEKLFSDHKDFRDLPFRPGKKSENKKYLAGMEQELVSGDHINADPLWPAWYPVIDPDRCNACGQCADFCLFGVYQKTKDKVTVINPQGCKNNCPACARICPRIAIVFPKYATGGPIGGSDSIDETLELQRQQQDSASILGNDIYQALEQRKMKRRSVIREDVMKEAIRERDEKLGAGSGKDTKKRKVD